MRVSFYTALAVSALATMSSAIAVNSESMKTVRVVQQAQPVTPTIQVSKPVKPQLKKPHRTVVSSNGALGTGKVSFSSPVKDLKHRIEVAKIAAKNNGASLNPGRVVTVRRGLPEPKQPRIVVLGRDGRISTR